jgi:type IV secretion system protein VirD4
MFKHEFWKQGLYTWCGAFVGMALLGGMSLGQALAFIVVLRHLRFLGTPAVAESTAKSSFNPAELRKGKLDIFLILPPEHMRAQAGLLRMWIAGLLRAVVRGGLGEKQKVHFILDEAASLGHLEAIDDAVDKYRGYGVRLQFYFQSVGQVSKCFPEQEQTLLSNTSQIFFGVNDQQTAELVSNRLGERTIVVDSGGQNRGGNRGESVGSSYSSSSGSSNGESSNWNQQARKLLNPDEVIALPPRTAITLTPGVRPIRTTLTRYYERAWFRGFREAVSRFVTAAVLCLFFVMVAWALSV